jgi:hypothetical protein
VEITHYSINTLNSHVRSCLVREYSTRIVLAFTSIIIIIIIIIIT